MAKENTGGIKTLSNIINKTGEVSVFYSLLLGEYPEKIVFFFPIEYKIHDKAYPELRVIRFCSMLCHECSQKIKA